MNQASEFPPDYLFNEKQRFDYRNRLTPTERTEAVHAAIERGLLDHIASNGVGAIASALSLLITRLWINGNLPNDELQEIFTRYCTNRRRNG